MGPNNPHYGYYGEQKRGLNFKLIAVIAGGVILIAVLIFTITALNSRNNIGTQSQHLSARLGNLSALTADGTKNLRSGDLQKINAETSIITDGAQADLANILPKKADKAVLASESDASTTQNLASAALAGTYDATYKKALQQKLESITALLSEMYAKTNSKSTREKLNTDYKNYATLLANLGKITV